MRCGDIVLSASCRQVTWYSRDITAKTAVSCANGRFIENVGHCRWNMHTSPAVSKCRWMPPNCNIAGSTISEHFENCTDGMHARLQLHSCSNLQLSLQTLDDCLVLQLLLLEGYYLFLLLSLKVAVGCYLQDHNVGHSAWLL